MAEAVAAFYVVETAVEAGAAGAVAVSGATAPLHAKFSPIRQYSETPAFRGSTANIVKNKLYVVGGEEVGQSGEHGVHVFSFPSDFGSSKVGEDEATNIDYELQQPSPSIDGRPLATHTSDGKEDYVKTQDHSQRSSLARTKHTSVTIGDKVYILAGLASLSYSSRRSNTEHTIPLDTILSLDTSRNTYSLIAADETKGTEGTPEPRYQASATSSPFPNPGAMTISGGPSIDAYGTIFLHGGYDMAGQALHDSWTFDIGAKAWHRLPSIVEEAVLNISIPGQIAYVNHQLWYCNDSTVMYLDLAERDSTNDVPTTSEAASISSGRVGTGQWQVVYPPPETDPAVEGMRNESSTKSDGLQAVSDGSALPTYHLLPITTGAGRTYLISFASVNPQNMRLFQITSAPNTAAKIKDVVRDKASAAMPSLPNSWKSGKFEWSKVEVIQASKKDGELRRPSQGLEDFSVATWPEYGDKLIIWGGHASSEEEVRENWIVSFN